MRQHILLLIVALACTNSSFAAFNLKRFDNPEYAQRYEGLIYQMRCLVCQNQTIADSDADLAKDLRNEIYKMIKAGKTDQQIVDFMVARYGEFVLYKPRVEQKTWLLWGGPALLLFAGVATLIWNISRKNRQSDPGIEQSALDKAHQLLGEDDRA